MAAYVPWGSSAAQSELNLRKRLDKSGVIEAKGKTSHSLDLSTGRYSFSVSLPAQAFLADTDEVRIALRTGGREVASKILHVGDPDLYTQIRAGGATEVRLESNARKPVPYRLLMHEWPEPAASDRTLLEAEPNDTWSEANEFDPGQTVWGTADDKPYISALNDTSARNGRVPYQQSTSPDTLAAGGIDWFKFRYDGDRPKLVHFELDLFERDNLPVDVSVFRIVNGEAVAVDEGVDPVTPPHEVQALPGNKFTARIITKGVYYVRVDANHVLYQLRTSVFDPPPYDDPRLAVRAGMDYIISAGDSWHANTPRHGGVVNRVSSTHVETQLCIACHATHFPVRAELTANKNGYPVNKRWALEFLTERLYNNPRPFYGHPEASWTRVISAPANVLSRLTALLNMYEDQFDSPRRISLLEGVGGYLKLYYKGREVLPNDETNGNTPLVSTYEVAVYSWKVFNELGIQTGNAEWRGYADRVRLLVDQDEHKNLIDLCYQTIAMIEIDRQGFAEKIRRNTERILSLQRPDGQWSMLLDPASTPVEFQTYHCLYTLALAGYKPEHPQIAKSLKFTLKRQQPYGGWFDPRQTYENFGTPFRETQFAVMALSQLYPINSQKGWQGGPGRQPARLSRTSALQRLDEIDRIWSPSDAALIGDLREALGSDEPLMSAAAARALGRIGDAESLPGLKIALGSGSKMVQLSAAQALRNIAAVKTGTGMEIKIKGGIQSAMTDRDARTRWGATRIFSQHFSHFTQQSAYADSLIVLLKDVSVTVRMQAVKSLMQFYWWTKEEPVRDRIASAFTERLGVDEHPWVRRNLIENFYSLADENVRYLYNNWIALLAQSDDREKARRGHLTASRRMAERVASVLVSGNQSQRDGMLQALTEFHLRTGGYVNAGRYTRIGNDVETIKFYQEETPVIERAILPYLSSKDPLTRERAVLAAFTLRENAMDNLPLLVMKRLLDDDQSVRDVAAEFYSSLPLKVRDENRAETIAALRDLLGSDNQQAQVAALGRIKSLEADFATRESFDDQIRRFVLSTGSKAMPAAIRALETFPHLSNDAQLQSRIAESLQSSDAGIVRASAQLTLSRLEWRESEVVSKALDSLLRTIDPGRRRVVLGLVDQNLNPQDDDRIINLIAASLADENGQVRAAALSALRKVRGLASDLRLRPALARIAQDPNEKLQEQAIALYSGEATGAASVRSLDYPFFVNRVMPLLAARGRDGNACVNCHSNHAILKLNPPDSQGRWTEDQLKENFQSALRVIDLGNPENSLILRKPTTDSVQEGVVGAKKLSHGGGQRWMGTDDPAYRTVWEWVNGAKLQQTSK